MYTRALESVIRAMVYLERISHIKEAYGAGSKLLESMLKEMADHGTILARAIAENALHVHMEHVRDLYYDDSKGDSELEKWWPEGTAPPLIEKKINEQI
jgi:hypothetical protein